MSSENKDLTLQPGSEVNFSPLNILVAEDDAMNNKYISKILNKLGYEPDMVCNGEKALNMAQTKNYDIIFMDVRMPVKDGLETTRIIRNTLNVQPVIIALTANAITGDKEDCLNAGMNDYLSKPFRFNEIAIIIEKWATLLKMK